MVIKKEDFDSILTRLFHACGVKNQNSLAEKIGISPSAVSETLKKRRISDKWLISLALKHGINPKYVLEGKGLPKINYEKEITPVETDEFVFVRKAKTKLSGGPGAFTSEDFYPEKFAFRRDWLKRLTNSPSKVVLLEIIGDSMAPEIQDGDLVLVDMSRQEIRSGQIYAFAINIGDTAAAKVKRLYLDDEENLIIAVRRWQKSSI